MRRRRRDARYGESRAAVVARTGGWCGWRSRYGLRPHTCACGTCPRCTTPRCAIPCCTRLEHLTLRADRRCCSGGRRSARVAGPRTRRSACSPSSSRSLPGTALGILMTLSPDTLVLVRTAAALDALRDQQLAGVVMWAFGGSARRRRRGALRQLAARSTDSADRSRATAGATRRDQPASAAGGSTTGSARRASPRSSLNKVFPDHWSFMLGEIALYCFVVLVAHRHLPHASSSTPSDTAGRVPRQLRAAARRAACRRRTESTIHLSFDVRAGLVMRQIHHWAALVFLAAIVAAPLPHLLHRRVPPAPRSSTGSSASPCCSWRSSTASPATRCPTTCCRAPAAHRVLDRRRRSRSSAPGSRSCCSAASSRRRHHSRLFVIHVLLVPAAHRRPAHRPPRDPLAPEAHAVPGPRPHRATTSSARSCGRRTPRRSVGLFAVVAARARAARRPGADQPDLALRPVQPAGRDAPRPNPTGTWAGSRARSGSARRGTCTSFGYDDLRGVLAGDRASRPSRSRCCTCGRSSRRFTHDHAEHHLLDRPRDRPVRTAIGVGVLTFYSCCSSPAPRTSGPRSSTCRCRRCSGHSA